MSSSHQSKFPCIIITIIIILLFFLSFSTLLTVNLFVLFWRCFVMLNSYFVCFIIYIFFFNFEFFFVDIIFVPKIGVCFSFYPVSLIFEYEAKPHIRWPHIREYEAGESGANFTSVSNRSMWNCYSFQPVGPWLNCPFTDLGAEGCCRSLTAFFFHDPITWIILGMGPSNERWSYIATPPPIGGAQNQNDSCISNISGWLWKQW